MNSRALFLIANLSSSLFCSEKKLPFTKTSIYLVRTTRQGEEHTLQPVFPIIVKEKTSHEESKMKIK